MKYKSIFICYSPSHLLSGLALFDGDINSTLFILTPALWSQAQSFLKVSLKVCILNIPSFTSSGYHKVLALIYCFLTPRFDCERLYMPNASHVYVCLISSRLSFASLIYIDEGNTYLSLIRHSRLGVSQGPNRFISRIFSLMGIYLGSNIIDNPCFVKYYAHNSFLLNESWINVNFLPFPDIDCSLINTLALSNFSHDPDSILFISSPLTENGWTEFKHQEVTLLLSFLRTYFPSFPLLVIKPHYRDDLSKFSKLYDAFDDIHVLEANIPLQLYSSTLHFRSIVSFHSSAIFSDFTGSPPIFSLSPLIYSPECISLTEGLNELLPFYPKLRLVRSLNHD